MQFLLASSALLIFASIPVLIENNPADPITIARVRLLFAVLLCFATLKQKKTFFQSFAEHRKAYLSLGIIFFIHWCTYFWSIKLSSGSFGLLGLSTYGFQLSIMGIFILKERIEFKHILSGILILCALFLIYPKGLGPGFFIGILSGFFYALIPILHKKHQSIPADQRTIGQFFFALLCFLAWPQPWKIPNLTSAQWIQLVYLGIAGTFIAHSIWIRLSTIWKTTTTGTLYYSIVPLTLLFNTLINGEKHHTEKWLGAFLIIIANLMLLKKTQNPPTLQENN